MPQGLHRLSGSCARSNQGQPRRRVVEVQVRCAISKLRTVSFKVSKHKIDSLWRLVIAAKMKAVSVNHVVASLVNAIEYAKFHKFMTPSKALELQDHLRAKGRGAAAHLKNEARKAGIKIKFVSGEGFVRKGEKTVHDLREKYHQYQRGTEEMETQYAVNPKEQDLGRIALRKEAELVFALNVTLALRHAELRQVKVFSSLAATRNEGRWETWYYPLVTKNMARCGPSDELTDAYKLPPQMHDSLKEYLQSYYPTACKLRGISASPVTLENAGPSRPSPVPLFPWCDDTVLAQSRWQRVAMAISGEGSRATREILSAHLTQEAYDAHHHTYYLIGTRAATI
eukprot:GEMP01048198.1.p1 GENE.GEMP01048198.1~~GEMP01048198.1.p1  ORF type:complete len:341 (+),score=101.40 GEMP01048198.1:415-1437(+)